MPADQRNWNYYTYESDDGTTYNIRAAVEWAAIAAHGLAARTTGAPRYIASKQQSPRKVTYRDPTTFRSRTGPIGTATAYAGIDLGDVAAFHVPGLTATVDYEAAKKTPERVPTTLVGGQLADHA